MQKALQVIEQTDDAFEQVFGRRYGGVIDTYKMDDADFVIVTMGATTGTAREAVDVVRSLGMKIGLLKVRFLRPFPDKKIREILSGKQGFVVIDKNVCFGWNTGVLYMEIKAAISELGHPISSMPAIGGLGGADISVDQLVTCIQVLVKQGSQQPGQLDTYWFQ
jgi:pyruvate ferredoxin oxidoreductase alpha subunit/phenylglyoxylate dehydrogenase alpha subunit